MDVVFIFRGYGKDSGNIIVDRQRNAIEREGINITCYTIENGGLFGYIKAFQKLKRELKGKYFDLIHAHYNISGFVSALASKKPVCCSLMGSDIFQQNNVLKLITKLFSKYLWKSVIVKSLEMKQLIPSALIIPNGVDFINFRPINKNESQNFTGFDHLVHNIIFVAKNPEAKVKNLELAKHAIKLTGMNNIKLHIISDIDFSLLPYYYNAADLILLTSFSEGSPNVIKEAMACNCPIVATDVGDIRQMIEDTEGCFITSFDPIEISNKIKLALNFGKRTNGREKIKHLDNKIIAKQIISVYKKILKNYGKE